MIQSGLGNLWTGIGNLAYRYWGREYNTAHYYNTLYTIHYCIYSSRPIRLQIFCTLSISTSYRTEPSAIWQIFTSFSYFAIWNKSKIWETCKIFVNITRGYCATTSLSLILKLKLYFLKVKTHLHILFTLSCLPNTGTKYFK